MARRRLGQTLTLKRPEPGSLKLPSGRWWGPASWSHRRAPREKAGWAPVPSTPPQIRAQVGGEQSLWGTGGTSHQVCVGNAGGGR